MQSGGINSKCLSYYFNLLSAALGICRHLYILKSIQDKCAVFFLLSITFQRCKNETHTMLVSKAVFLHLRFSSLLLRFLKPKTNAKYCAFEYLSNGTKFITIAKFLEKLKTKEKRLHTYPE